MNIATWISREKNMLCTLKWLWINLLKNSQLIEASLNNPKLNVKEISLADLYSIGMLAKEILSDSFSPAFAHEFMVYSIAPTIPGLASYLNIWKPNPNEGKENKNGYYQE